MNESYGDKNLTFECANCEKSFYSREILSLHRKYVHDYHCDYCDKTFTSKSNLSTHIRATHKTQKIFSCEICDISFPTKGQLYYHKLLVHQENISCDICNTTFSTKIALKVHISTIHLGQKNFECKYCIEKFSQLASLNKQTHISNS